MNQLEMIVSNPITYIVLESIAILVLLVFVVRWTKEQRLWKVQKEEQKKREQEETFLKKLSNERRSR